MLFAILLFSDFFHLKSMNSSIDTHLNLTPHSDNTPLMKASIWGHEDVVLELLQRGANVDEQKEKKLAHIHRLY
jgi:ankyrin repeat protein